MKSFYSFHLYRFAFLVMSFLASAQIDTTLFAQRLKIDKKNPSDTVTWITKRKIALNGKLKSYEKFFNLVNGDKETVRFKNVKDADELVFDPATEKYYKVRNKRQLNPDKRVMGWHPYWMNEELRSYHYEYLTDLMFFAYDIKKEDGSYNDSTAINSWLSSGISDSAKKYNINLLLCVTSYGFENNSSFLTNIAAKKNFCDSIKSLLIRRGGHGVDLDFTGIDASLKNSFVELVKMLRTKLGDTALIYLHIPSGFQERNYLGVSELLKGTRPVVDLFIVNGYDYELFNSHKSPHPMSALDSLKKTYEWCKLNGIDSSRLVLNMPLYGSYWERTEKGWDMREIAYEDILALTASKNKITELRNGSTFIRKDNAFIWFESGESLDLKMAWAKENGFKGVGLWGLGYAGSDTDVWEAILDNFAVSRYIPVQPVFVDKGAMYNLFYAISEHRKVLGYSLVIIVFMIVIATLLSLLDWRIREIFFRNYIYRAILAILAILLVVVAMNWISNGSSGIVLFFYGLITGGALTYMISRMYLHFRKKMP